MPATSFPEDTWPREVERRLRNLETAPRAGYTTVDSGSIVTPTWKSAAAYTGHMITYETAAAVATSTAWVRVCGFRASIPLASIRGVVIPVNVGAAGVSDTGDVRILQYSRFVLGDQIGISVGAIGFGAAGTDYTVDVTGTPIADSEYLRVAFDVEIRRTAGTGSVSAYCDMLALLT